MNDRIFVNDLIHWVGESGSHTVERILWIDEGHAIAFTFDINAAKGFPQPRNISEMQEAIADGIAFKQQQDPWLKIYREEDLNEAERSMRDEAWNIISAIVEREPEIYYRNTRGSLIEEVIDSYNLDRDRDKLGEKRIYKYLRRYWQRGKNKNALLPDYVNSAGKGKIKGQSEKKRGKPRKYAASPEIGVGINIKDEDRRIFRLATSKFYHNSQRNSLTAAYRLMLKEYYAEEIRFDERGVKKSILLPPEQQPTLNQFRYWYQLEQTDIRKNITTRKGARAYALESRAILGTSQQETIGPGDRFQIDATVADVYLVSRYNRDWIIGRPIVYVIIDVFSRMIVGVYVGLEGPSWIGAMMALSNCASDKVKFCAEYGIAIAPEEWPCHHLPKVILGDCGELAGANVETLIPNLNIHVENAAPYRPDWKGLVERHFRIVHQQIRPFVPGYVDADYGTRGGKDYRLDSKLDLEQFTEIIIHLIRHHNNHHYLSDYDRDKMAIADDIVPIPRELWNWGIANRSGALRSFPEDIVKMNLMPASRATITARGIKFKAMYYTCQKAKEEYWFEKARNNTLADKSADISYDPRNLNFIYLRSPDGREFEKCQLIDRQARYTSQNLYEIEYLLAFENFQQQQYQSQELQETVDLMAEIESVVERAENSSNSQGSSTPSKKQRISNIAQNRATEKAKRRKNEAYELDKPDTSAEDPDSDSSNASLQPNYLPLLIRNRQSIKHDSSTT